MLIGAAPRGELPVGEGGWRRPPQQADDDDDDDDDDSVINDEDDEAVVVNNELQYGWMAAYALLILEEPSEFLAAVRQLPPRPQLAGVLAVCFRRPLPVADEGRALRSVLRTAVRAGRWNTVVFVSQGATEGSLHGVHPLRRGCFNSTPVTLASWTLGGGFHPRRLQFDNPKQYTLNGCKLRTAFFLAPPTMQLIHKAGDPTTRPGGFTGRVLDAMSVAMNATFKLQMWSTDKKKFGKYRGVTLPRELGDTVTLVPSSVGNVERSGLWNVVASFSAGLWLLLVAMVALAVLALVLMGGERAARLPVGRVVVVVVVALIGQPTSVRLSGARARPSSNVARILHGAWLLTALVTSTAYQAKLWSIVSRTNRVGLFSLDDLIDTGLPVSMPSVILYNMMDTQNASLRVLVDRGLLSASMRKPGDVGALKWGSRIVLLDDAMADYWGAYKIQVIVTWACLQPPALSGKMRVRQWYSRRFFAVYEHLAP
ncbi:hypothetical protein FOCC_FOCC003147 [Frankliniella occidentalis]|nr:hypothetical protein FOCC_FOCC003147 [Frankliniella occidentalis]